MVFERIRERVAEFGPTEHIRTAIIGLGVIFACLGMGEAVYRLAFFDFDGATDRLPIEMLFGFAFACLAAKVVRRMSRDRIKTYDKIRVVCDGNRKIAQAVEAIAMPRSPGDQQAVRVIRDEVARIEWELEDIVSR